jgi:PAS domain S-box-containing protein
MADDTTSPRARNSSGDVRTVVPEFTYRLDLRSGLLDYLSPWAHDLLGVPLGQVREAGYAALEGRIHPEDRPEAERLADDFLDRGKPGTSVLIEYRLQRADGHYVPVAERRFLVGEGRTEPTALVGVVRSRDAGRRAFDLADVTDPDLVVNESTQLLIKDRDLTFAWGNEACAAPLGVAAPALVGKTDFDFYPEEMAKSFRATDAFLLKHPEQIPDTTVYFFGSEGRIVQRTKAPLRDAEGRVVGLLVTHTDVSENPPESAMALSAAAMGDLEEAVIGLTVDGAIATWSQGAQQMYGYYVDQVRGRPATMLATEEKRRGFQQEIERTVAGASVRDFPSEHLTQGGRRMKVLLTMSPILGRQGEVAGVSVIARDVSEREHADRAFRESAARFLGILESVRDVAYKVDLRRGTFSYVSPSVEDLLGYTPAELIALGFKGTCRLIHPEDISAFLASTRELLRDPESASRSATVEYRVRRIDGSYVWASDNRRAVRDEEGTATAIVGTVRDIAERRRSEDRLRESEQRFRLLAETAWDGISICEWDPQTGRRRLVFCNDRFVEMSGYTREELEQAEDLNEFIVPEESSEESAQIHRRLAAGERCTSVASWRRPDGEENYHEWSAVSLKLGDRHHLFGVDRDITQRMRAEQRLRESEERFRRLVETAFVGVNICDWDPETGRRRLVFCNDRFVEMSGYTREELEQAEDLNELIVPQETPEEGERIFERVLRGERANGIGVWKRPDGKDNYYEWSAIRVKMGGKYRLVGIDHDITERKLAEERLREVLESARDVIYKLNIGEGAYEYVSPSVEAMFGFTPDEFIALGVEGERDRVHPEDIEELGTDFDGLIPGVEPAGWEERIEYRWRHKNGQWRWVSNDRRVVRDEAGRPVAVVGTMRDITERKRLEEQMRRAQKLESLGVLAGGIAHDFNNLLTGVLGNAGLALMDLPEDSPARYSVRKIEEAAETAAELANQMLAYSGRGRLLVEPVDLSALVGQMRHLLEAAASKQVSLCFELGEGLPVIEADASQIKQVVMNLVSNASEAIGDGGGVVRITTSLVSPSPEYFSETYVRGDSDAESYLCLRVSDTGSGMDEETKGQIFDPFFTTKFTGRGLGLAAVLGIVRGHEGAVKVSSQPARGTTFEILFPVAEDAGVATPDDSRPGHARARAAGTVLVVDDERTVRTVAGRILEQAGFRTLSAASGTEAVRLLKAHAEEVAAILLDMTMPDGDGPTAFEQLRAVREDVPVILSSGYDRIEAEEEFGSEEPDAFLQKPYSPEKLEATLSAVLAEHSRRS